MIRGRVLVIDADEWTSNLLKRELANKGYEVDVCGTARDGFDKACHTVPDCVVSALDLPDIDGLWVARRIRTEGGPVSRVPLVVVSEASDKETRVQTLNVGADVFLDRPVSNDEIVAQVDALVAMARRFRPQSMVAGEEASSAPPSLTVAFRGDLSSFPLASILMMLELERRTGTLEVSSGSGTKAILNISSGLFASSEVDETAQAPIEVLRKVLSWRSGRFVFRPREVTSLPPPRGSVGALVLEAMRLDDEQRPAAKR